MSTNNSTPDTSPDQPLEGAAPGKPLSPAAQRALEEAAQRRLEIDARAAELAKQKEHQGRAGWSLSATRTGRSKGWRAIFKRILRAPCHIRPSRLVMMS
jgi:hypothetical protein